MDSWSKERNSPYVPNRPQGPNAWGYHSLINPAPVDYIRKVIELDGVRKAELNEGIGYILLRLVAFIVWRSMRRQAESLEVRACRCEHCKVSFMNKHVKRMQKGSGESTQTEAALTDFEAAASVPIIGCGLIRSDRQASEGGPLCRFEGQTGGVRPDGKLKLLEIV